MPSQNRAALARTSYVDWCGGDGLASTCTHCSADGRSAELSLKHCSASAAISCGHSSGTLRCGAIKVTGVRSASDAEIHDDDMSSATQ